MKDMISERLILLATAQDRMSDAADELDQWDKSQLSMEKSAFESMNASDQVLCMAKEGKYLVEKLQEYYRKSSENVTYEEIRKITLMLDEIQGLFVKIKEESVTVNEISHRIEGEAASQKEIRENIKKSITNIKESVDSAVACAEFMLAEL
jgi:hypothetical protein